MCLAIPGKIETISGGEDDPMARMGKVNFGGIRKEVSLACVPEARVGDYALVHVGFAISVINEEEAGEVLKYLNEMGEVEEALGETP